MKQKYIFYLALYLISNFNVAAQIQLEWLNSIGGTNSDFGYSIELDSNKNVFVAGQFRGSVSFDPNSNAYDFTAVSIGDVYIQKLDNNGNFLWAKAFLGSANSEIPIITIDNNGNIYITSTFTGTIDLDPGINEDFHTSTDPGNNTYIVKLNNNGDYLWGKTFENVSSNQFIRPGEIAIDNNGNILLSGEFQATVDFNYGASDANLTGAGPDGFLLKIDTNGDFLWVKQFSGAFAYFYLTTLAFDSQNNIIGGGAFKGSSPTDFNPGPGVFNMTSPDINNNDLFILKLTENGDFIWAKKAEGYSIGVNSRGDDRVHSIVIDNNDNILYSGGYRNIINFEAGTTAFILDSGINGCVSCIGFMTGFVAKMDANGNMVWAKKIEGNNFAGSSGNANYYKSSIVLKLNTNQDLFFGYAYRGTLDYTINGVPYSIPGDIDNWRMAFNRLNPANGDFLSVHPVNNNFNSFLLNIDVVDNELYALGSYYSELFFDTTTSTTSVDNGTGFNSLDAFVVKYIYPSLSVEEFDYNTFSMYPNPAKNQLNINSKSQIKTITIHDLNGRLLKSIKPKDTKLELQLNINDLSNGIYFLKIYTEKFETIKKFIKE